MGRRSYRIDEFFGIDQSRNENAIAPGMSADACNMDTEDGSLAVARGYVRHIETPVPGTAALHRLYVHQRGRAYSSLPSRGMWFTHTGTVHGTPFTPMNPG